MPHPLLIFSHPDYLIWIVAINSHTLWQTVQIQISWLLRSQLIWIYTVCKGRVYPGSAGQGLNVIVYNKAIILVSVHFSMQNIELSRGLGRASGQSYVSVCLYCSFLYMRLCGVGHVFSMTLSAGNPPLGCSKTSVK